MLIKVPSALNLGLHTLPMDVEVNIASRGLPAFEIVGLPTKAVAESKHRVRTAIVNSGFNVPSRRITVNLAPADVPKEGSFYDLPIAVGLLAVTLGTPLPEESLFFGELSLDGSLRHTKGALLLALFAQENGIKNIFVPKLSANEAAAVKGLNVFPLTHLNEIPSFLYGETHIAPLKHVRPKQKSHRQQAEFDMSEVLGHEQAKRALEIAAAGAHNAFMIGSPGSGKTMLARAFPGILPPLTEKESLEVTKIYSVAGNIPPKGSLLTQRPFRCPHHNVSLAGLIGGGSTLRPGEVSLAHRGTLFLDEFNEFSRTALEGLRQPLEDGMITICRSKEKGCFPSCFILLASTNPCPCGYLYHPEIACSCTPRQIECYQKKTSGPLLDRIDIHIEIPFVDIKEFSSDTRARKKTESSKQIQSRIVRARHSQEERFKTSGIYTNAEMHNNHIDTYCTLSSDAEQLLLNAARSFHLSARAYFKILRISRTIADLEGTANITTTHIAEALQYRPRMRETLTP